MASEEEIFELSDGGGSIPSDTDTYSNEDIDDMAPIDDGLSTRVPRFHRTIWRLLQAINPQAKMTVFAVELLNAFCQALLNNICREIASCEGAGDSNFKLSRAVAMQAVKEYLAQTGGALKERVLLVAQQAIDEYLTSVECEFQQTGVRSETVGSATKGSKTPTKKGNYNVFCKAKREDIKAANPDATGTQVNQLLGAAWKALSEEEKSAYVEGAATPVSSTPITPATLSTPGAASKQSATRRAQLHFSVSKVYKHLTAEFGAAVSPAAAVLIAAVIESLVRAWLEPAVASLVRTAADLVIKGATIQAVGKDDENLRRLLVAPALA